MKISKIFHWLYLSLLVLPIVTIPVFMIYSHRHDLTQRTEVDIQYKYQSNEVNSVDDLIVGNIYYLERLYIVDSPYEFSFNTISYESYESDLGIGDFVIDDIFFDYVSTISVSYENFYYSVSNGLSVTLVGGLGYFNINDLVFMYDSSLLPYFVSNNYLPQYTDYNVIESVSVNDTESDIMSQFTTSLYNTTERYYNFDNFFALGDIRQWFNTNFFNGNPSLGFGIAWHLLTYWFVVSIFWLIFDVLMYLPLLVHRWLDKGAIA